VTINYQAGADVLSMSRRETSDIKYIVLHHSATTTGNVAVFRDYHIHQLGFADVGYHYVICNGQGGPDGEVQPGRPELMTGAHAPGRNADSIGVCLVGDFTQGKPTTAQMLALYGLLKEIMRRYRIAPERVLAHREVNQTDCPGSLDVAAIRTALSRPPAPKIRIGNTELEGIMVDDKVYAPVRALIDALNYQVGWDGETRTVNIISGGKQ